jgi:hypothetical protein
MCIKCAPIKEFKGDYGALWRNWVGQVGSMFLPFS